MKPDGSPLADDIVSAGFFRVVGIPLLAGRLFTPEEERDPNRRSVIINEAMALKYWPGVDPIGKRFSVVAPPKQVWRTVIGVVGNAQIAGRESAVLPEMYWPILNYPDLKFVRAHFLRSEQRYLPQLAVRFALLIERSCPGPPRCRIKSTVGWDHDA